MGVTKREPTGISAVGAIGTVGAAIGGRGGIGSRTHCRDGQRGAWFGGCTRGPELLSGCWRKESSRASRVDGGYILGVASFESRLSHWVAEVDDEEKKNWMASSVWGKSGKLGSQASMAAGLPVPAPKSGSVIEPPSAPR